MKIIILGKISLVGWDFFGVGTIVLEVRDVFRGMNEGYFWGNW
jgi:hypothetical protein